MLVGCQGSSPRLGTDVQFVCGGASQCGGPGRPTVEAHDHDVTNTGSGKSGRVVKHQ